MKHRFVLISRWQLGCTACLSVEAVWRLITAIREWPQWWVNVAAVQAESEDGATPRVGDSANVTWRTRLGYGVRLNVVTTGVLPPFELEGAASGDLQGKGLWLLEPQPRHNAVTVTYRWDVHLNRRWMQVLAPLLRPAFAWNHFDIMRAGARGMARRLNCELLKYQDYTFSPGEAATDLRSLQWPQSKRA